MLNLTWVEGLDDVGARDVRELLLAARAADGRPEVTAEGPLPGEFASGSHLLAHDEGVLAGYAHLDTAGDSFGRQVAEVIVRPGLRGRGTGSALVDAVLARSGAGTGEDKLRFWAHGDHPAAARIAERCGLRRLRELLVLHARVSGADWPEPVLPEGVSLRTFVPGQDEQAVVAVNARAFDWHPEQGRLTEDELRATEREDWFDPAGFFLAERAGTLLGFHWTKAHPADPNHFGGEEVGEVYVVGVDPAAQGGGLGKALTLAGLRHLAGRGLGQVILYVDGDNAPALAVYSRFGFTRFATDVQYSR